MTSSATPVSRLSGPDIPLQFSTRFRSVRPVLFPSFASQWPAVTNWGADLSLIAQRLGGREKVCSVLVSNDDRRFMDNDILSERIDMTVDQVLKAVFPAKGAPGEEGAGHSRRVYLRDFIGQEAREDLDLASLSEAISAPLLPDLQRIWVGSKGNCTPLHYDRCHGLLVQLVGRKKFTLISPEQSSMVYPHGPPHPHAHGSKVNVKEFDDGDRAAQERFKKFSSVDRFEADLSAGDVLYTPPGWWHEVDSLSEGISITVPFSMRQNSPVPPNFVS